MVSVPSICFLTILSLSLSSLFPSLLLCPLAAQFDNTARIQVRFDHGDDPMTILPSPSNHQQAVSSGSRSGRNSGDIVAMPPLHIAARHGHCKAALVLLEAGAEVDQHDRAGSTALNTAVRSGNVLMVRLLWASVV